MGRHRKPGRPKGSKNKPKTNKLPASLVAKLRKLDISEFKPSRGRPKGSTNKKRGPGRPKGSTNKKRGPGRPKGKVGRPKGSTNSSLIGKTFSATITLHRK